jgi:DNA-binding NtrC family response regulator
VLRVLQEGEYEPVGSTQPVKVDVRVLAATHRDLKARAAEGLFREDLLFRLNVIPLEVPPLRERPGDVRLLGERFLEEYAAHHDLPAPCLTELCWERLSAYSWPGNVRELKNLIERFVILYRGAEIGPEELPMDLLAASGARPTAAAGARGAGDRSAKSGDLPGGASTAPGDAGPYARLPLREAREALERDLIQAALERHGGNVTRAAAELGLERTHLHKRIRAMGLTEE